MSIAILVSGQGAQTPGMGSDLYNYHTIYTETFNLCEQGAEARCAELVRTAVAGQTVEVELLYWISRNPAKRVEWSLGSLPLIGHLILNELEKDYGGERLKAQNMLRNRYGQPEFLKERHL